MITRTFDLIWDKVLYLGTLVTFCEGEKEPHQIRKTKQKERRQNSVKFRVKFRKRKKFEDGAATPGDKVALEVEVGSEELEVKGGSSRSPLDELKRIAEGRGE